MTSKTLLMQNTIIVLVAIFLGITTILAFTTTKELNHKTSTNCKENQDE